MIRWIFLLPSPQRHIFYFFQIPFGLPQPSNSNSDTDLSTDPSLLPLQNQVHLLSSTAEIEGTIIARPRATGIKYPTLLPSLPEYLLPQSNPKQQPRTRRLRITGNFH